MLSTSNSNKMLKEIFYTQIIDHVEGITNLELRNKDIDSILPLSGYENSKILLCLDEKNKPIYFTSDQFGFNNVKNLEYIEFLLIGDSYVQGHCVDNKNTQRLTRTMKSVVNSLARRMLSFCVV